MLLGFNNKGPVFSTRVLLKCFYIFIFCSGRAFQRYIDYDNPTVASDMADKNILLQLIFEQTLLCHVIIVTLKYLVKDGHCVRRTSLHRFLKFRDYGLMDFVAGTQNSRHRYQTLRQFS